MSVNKEDEIMCITSQGNTIKLKVTEISTMGKNALGVRIVNIKDPDVLVGFAKVVTEE